MRSILRHLRLAALAAALCLGMTPTVGLAKTPPPPVPPIPDASALDTQEAKDSVLVDSAMTAAGKGGIVAIADSIPALQQVLARAPRDYGKIDEKDGVIRYRARDLADFLLFSAGTEVMIKGHATAARKVVWTPDIYPIAGLLVGVYFNEIGQSDMALPPLQTALGLEPDNSQLVTETGMALIKLGRGPEALPLYDKTLALDTLALADLDRARVLRAKGFILTDMNRLDEAEQAYKDSLKLQPDHAGAKSELAYIAHLRAGGAAGPVVMTTTDKARAGQ